MRSIIIFSFAYLIVSVIAATPAQSSEDLRRLIDTVKAAQRDGEGIVAASEAGTALAERNVDNLLEILSGIKGANPLAANLLRSAVETLVDRALKSEQKLPIEGLVEFIQEAEEHNARARQLAFEILKKTEPELAEGLLPELLTDPNPSLRRAAVAHWIAKATGHEAKGMSSEAQAAYEEALKGATDDDQVKIIAKGLKNQGVDISIRDHFGFITEWQIIGPFDNREMVGFDAAYPPELDSTLDAKYQGQLGDVEWKPIGTDDDYGVVDIAKSMENYKGSVMYLRAEVDSPRDQDVEVRLGTANAWKLWLNDEYLFGREEYHRGMILDQYRVPARLKPGMNVILLKLLQNEQSQDWAQSYKFQLRLTDEAGQAVRLAK